MTELPTYQSVFKAARAAGASALEADAQARAQTGGDDPAKYRPASEINDAARTVMFARAE